MLVPYASAPLYWFWNLGVYGTLAGAVVSRNLDRASWAVRSAAIAVFVGLAALAAGYTLLFYFEGHYNYYSGARFALPVLPIIAFVVVKAVRRSGLLLMGVALPGSALLVQLVGARV